MGMRLLPKPEFEKAKAAEQKREIDEGLKLARRVDNLREVVAQEEASLGEFRSKTVSIIHEQIAAEIQKKDNLTKEVQDLEDRKREARKSLDEEWTEVLEMAKDVGIRKNGLDVRAGELDRRETDVSDREGGSETRSRRLDTREKLIEGFLDEADKSTKKAQRILESARVADSDSKETARLRVVELTHREELVSSREESATMKETDLLAREKALADGLILLRDREAMLERDIKRTQK